MEIYFLRHGEAVDALPGGSDAERELTEKGHRQSAKVAQWLAGNKMVFDFIICSGRKRAQQTAEPVAEALGMQIITDTRLSGGQLTVGTLADMLGEFGSPERVLLVGHEPDFSDMVEALTGGIIEMKKGALAAVACDEVYQGEGILTLLLPPKWL